MSLNRSSFYQIINCTGLIWMRYARQEDDPTVAKLYDSTEEGKKVTRNSGDKYSAVFRRIEDPLLTKHAPSDAT